MILVIGGLDPSGGAGVGLDLRVLAAHERLGGAVVTTATVQSSVGLERHVPLDSAVIAAQIRAVLEDGPVAAVKIGALGSAAVARSVARALEGFSGPVVLDTVLGATVGAPLLDDPAALLPLFARAALVTPNLAEAAVLSGLSVADVPAMRHAAQALRQKGAAAVLLKGGHLQGEAVDVLAVGERVLELALPRRPHGARGTGCALATAIALRLGDGMPLEPAVRAAKTWLWEELARARPLGLAGRHVLLPGEQGASWSRTTPARRGS